MLNFLKERSKRWKLVILLIAEYKDVINQLKKRISIDLEKELQVTKKSLLKWQGNCHLLVEKLDKEVHIILLYR